MKFKKNANIKYTNAKYKLYDIKISSNILKALHVHMLNRFNTHLNGFGNVDS